MRIVGRVNKDEEEEDYYTYLSVINSNYIIFMYSTNHNDYVVI